MFAFVQRLAASNDRNGNPRRLFQVVTTDSVREYFYAGQHKANVSVAYYDEGYMGTGALPDLSEFVVMNLPDVAITTKEYNKLAKIAKPS